MSALNGKKIIITRSVESGPEFRTLLERGGASVLEVPTITLADPVDFAPVDSAIRKIGSYDLLIFTSANAVRKFFDRAGKLSVPKIATVGPKTSQAVAEYGYRVSIEPDEAAAAEELLAELQGRVELMECNILFPRAKEAREDLPTALRAEGARVDLVIVYETKIDPDGKPVLERIMRDRVDWITFASGSAVRNFLELGGKEKIRKWIEAQKIRIAVIGRITESAVRSAGLKVELVSPNPTMAGLAKALATSD
jgi:uroporphyrinogen III methyltransferase/synthase